MIADYAGCWIVEKGLKLAFSDYKPKDIAIRRPEQLEREEKRRREEAAIALQKKLEEDEKKKQAKREEAERKVAELRAKWAART